VGGHDGRFSVACNRCQLNVKMSDDTVRRWVSVSAGALECIQRRFKCGEGGGDEFRTYPSDQGATIDTAHAVDEATNMSKCLVFDMHR
jgi:hypothetical protein